MIHLLFQAAGRWESRTAGAGSWQKRVKLPAMSLTFATESPGRRPGYHALDRVGLRAGGRAGGDPALTLAETPAPYDEAGDRGRPLPEHLLARLWQRRAAREQGFRTDRGVRVRVLYPGRPGTGAGPDFRHALLEFEGVGLVRGDVEIHRRQQDWDAHGHSSDPNYNGVVLHAALETGASATSIPSGQPVPVVSLAPLLTDEDAGQSAPSPALWELLARAGYPRPASAGALAALLDRAGDQRFLSKSGRFQQFLGEQDLDQTLYEGLLEALGYRHNQQPFLTLAARAPYRALARAVASLPPEQHAGALESWLLGLSGLVPEGEAGKMARPPRGGFGRPMSGREWHCFRVRPANHPRRRIAGAARLLSRFAREGLAWGLARAAAAHPRELTAALTVPAGPGGGPACIGASRARDLAVNVVLPLLHAGAAVRGEAGPAAQYLELYHRFGTLQDNEITREMAGQLLDPGWGPAVNSARRQQGLVHLHRLLAGGSG